MAITNTPIFPQGFNNQCVTFVNADSTTPKTVFTAGTNGSKLEGIYINNTDSGVAYLNQLWLYNGSTAYLLGIANAAVSSGNTNAAALVNMLGNSGTLIGTVINKDVNGNPYLYLPFGWSIQVNPTVAVTAAKTLTFSAFGEDF